LSAYSPSEVFSSRRRVYPTAEEGEEQEEEAGNPREGQPEEEQNIQNTLKMTKKDMESLVHQVIITATFASNGAIVVLGGLGLGLECVRPRPRREWGQ